MMDLGHRFGANGFVLASTLLMICFGAILEGAPALIIFGPLLTPIALQLGVSPLHFGTVMVVAMGFGFVFPAGRLGPFRHMLDYRDRDPSGVRPMMKYLAVLFLALLALVFVPAFSLWLPARFGSS